MKFIYILLSLALVFSSCSLRNSVPSNYMMVLDKYVVMLPEDVPNLYEMEGEKEVEILTSYTAALTVLADEVGYMLLIDINKNPIALVEFKVDSERHWIYKEGKPVRCSFKEYKSFLEEYEEKIELEETGCTFEWCRFI